MPYFMGLLRARLINEDVIEMPADGPSFGTAPYGKCKWMSAFSRKLRAY